MANDTVRASQPPGEHQSLAGRAAFLWIALGLTVANFAVYGRLTGYQFLNFDDDWYIVNNTSVSHGFSWEGVRWACTALDYFYWQPLTWLSHMLDCQLFGLNAGSHHFTNLLIHAVNAVLVFAACAPPARITCRPAVVVTVEAIWKMKTALALPCASRVRSPDEIASDEVDAQIPGVRVRPPILPATATGPAGRDAASSNATVKSAIACAAAGSPACMVPCTVPGGNPVTAVPDSLQDPQ
jgi:hypothetical protein